MLNIKVLAQLKNYTLIQDLFNNNVYLYSYNNQIAWWDGKLHCDKLVLTTMSKMHLTWFKEWIGGGK
jgi:hypothetical protein